MAYLCICHAVKESDPPSKKDLVGTACGKCIQHKKTNLKDKLSRNSIPVRPLPS